MLVKAPWTDAQVTALNRYQRLDHAHPFTCGKCTGHRALIASAYGWNCEANCGYTQDWAHDWMLEVRRHPRIPT